MRLPRLYLLILCLIGMLAFLQYRLWFQSGGLRDYVRLKQAVNKQLSDNENSKKRNEDLLFQIQRLQNSKDAAESRARNELGMVKKDETFYQIVK